MNALPAVALIHVPESSDSKALGGIRKKGWRGTGLGRARTVQIGCTVGKKSPMTNLRVTQLVPRSGQTPLVHLRYLAECHKDGMRVTEK